MLTNELTIPESRTPFGFQMQNGELEFETCVFLERTQYGDVFIVAFMQLEKKVKTSFFLINVIYGLHTATFDDFNNYCVSKKCI